VSTEGSRAQLSLTAQLPIAFAKSSRGERIIEGLQDLSSGDVEFILQAPECSPQFVALLGTSARDAEDTGGFEELENMIGQRGLAPGPLSELLRACSPDMSLRAGVPEVVPEPPADSIITGPLPSIFSGMPLMAHAAAACSTRHLPPRAPPLETLATSKSASMLMRLATQRTDVIAKPKPKMSGGPLTKTASLPSLHPALSPARQRCLPPSLAGIANLRSKQMQKPLRPVSDFMHTDIEF